MFRLISNLRPWVSRAFGEVGYELTQFLIRRGCFQNYLFKNWLCQDLSVDRGEDLAEYTVSEWVRWIHIYKMKRYQDGWNITPDNIIQKMAENEAVWKVIHKLISAITFVKIQEDSI